MTRPTVQEHILKAKAELEAAGVEAPRREARLLMQLAAGVSPTGLIAMETAPLRDAGILARFEAFLQRRVAREPYAHIAGRAHFYGLDFLSDARGLVPRPDSEVVVETALAHLPGSADVSLADLGTGSACLLVAILKTRGNVRGVGVECDRRAAALALENLKRHDLMARARLVVSEWAQWRGWSEVDMIVSNPPYIASAEIDTLQDEVRSYDPILALDGGADGLCAFREIISLGADRMKDGSWLVLEIGHDQFETVPALMREATFERVAMARDVGGNPRVVSGRRPKSE